MINFLDENLDFFMILAAVATILAGLCFPSLLNYSQGVKAPIQP